LYNINTTHLLKASYITNDRHKRNSNTQSHSKSYTAKHLAHLLTLTAERW